MTSTTEDVPLLVVLDGTNRNAVEAVLAEDHELRVEAGGEDRRFVLSDTICPTRSTARQAIDRIPDLEPHERPRIALIDHMLQVIAGQRDQIRPHGLDVIDHLTRSSVQAGLEPPLSLMATGRYDEQLAYAFVHYGGSNAVDSQTRHGLSAIVEDLWATYDGARWREPVVRGGFELTREERMVLPFLERGMQPQVAVPAITARGLLPTPRWGRSEYGHVVGDIVEKAIAVRDRLYPVARATTDEDVAAQRRRFSELGTHDKVLLAEFVRDCGHCWLRLDLELDR